jgi:hypothetical protein
VLSRAIMYHPDFNMTPCAATSFMSGNVESLYPELTACAEAGDDQPDPAQQDAKYLRLLGRSKLHPAYPDWDVAMAGLLQCQAERNKGSLLDLYLQSNSHFVIEGHLPSQVPLSMIELVVMPQDEHDALSDDTKKELHRLFRDEQIKLVQGPKDVEPAARDAVVAEPRRQPRGICVCLPPLRRRNRLVPLTLPAEGGTIRFIAIGGPFAVVIGAPVEDRGYVDGYSVVVDWNATAPDDKRSAFVFRGGKQLHRHRNFNALQSFSMAHHYAISVRAGATGVTVHLSNGAAPNNRMEFHDTFGLSKSLSNFFSLSKPLAIGLSTDYNEVEFVDVTAGKH